MKTPEGRLRIIDISSLSVTVAKEYLAVRTEGIANVEYHQFSISALDTETLDAQHEGTLIETGPGFVLALTGITFGPVHVVIETLDTRPDGSSNSDWEVIEESAIESRENLLLTTAAGSVIAPLDPILAGRYHIRAYARGRDLNAGLEVDEPSEHYLFHLWPQEPSSTIDLSVRQILETDTAWSAEPVKSDQRTLDDIDRPIITIIGTDGDPVRVGVYRLSQCGPRSLIPHRD